MTMASSEAMFPPGYAEETIGPDVIRVAAAFIGLEIVFVFLRLAARYKFGTKLGHDDYLMAPALLFCISVCITAIVEVKIAGVGRHLVVLYATDLNAVLNWAKCGYAMEELYCLAIVFPKLSILVAYLRIFTERPIRIACYCTGAVVVLTATAGVITSLAGCRPFSARWDPVLVNTNCISFPKYWQGMSAPNIATDVVMLILPLPRVWRLNLPVTQKLALMGVFMLGSFGIVASIIRLTVTLDLNSINDDGTWVTAKIATWSLVEPGCYLIASCLPVLRPFFPGTHSKRVKKALGSDQYENVLKSSRINNRPSLPATWQSPHESNTSNNKHSSYIELV